MNNLEQIKEREVELRLAMLAGDVDKLDELISDKLIFTDHSGLVYTKEMDLHAHRSGVLKLHTLNPDEQQIQVFEQTAIVSVLMRMEGTAQGQAFQGNGRYTRVWLKENQQWKIVAGHMSFLRK
ncbi:nuclear transport factor 2 family protein [Daejeonella lutea]|uniref:DUF4440 domain-containing protein n=1 Tax=Daejeonella lutea TaxID=572036 RepID=A0A1T5CY19_9SPHI|nr:nuclear transport factor 2 family protein [Daejeonella lutea]SKB64243.1 protein of unknown function [Daejeonella lutea]